VSRYDDQVLDEFNRPVPGVSIYVYDDAGALDTLTADDASPLANPLTSDANGLFYFNAADGEKLLDFRFGFDGRTRYKQEGNLFRRCRRPAVSGDRHGALRP
jgi:hypothetical protein